MPAVRSPPRRMTRPTSPKFAERRSLTPPTHSMSASVLGALPGISMLRDARKGCGARGGAGFLGPLSLGGSNASQSALGPSVP